MSTDDGKALVQDIAAKIRILREQRDRLADALRPFTEGLYWVTDEQVEKARALLAEVAP